MCIQIKAKKKAKRENKDGGKTKLEIPVFQEWRMKKLEPFVGIFTMVGILCLIQIMIGNRWNGVHIFLFHCRHF